MSAAIGPVVGAIAIVLQNDATLLVKRKFDPDAGLWGFPGGKMIRGETFFACATRELHEETGITAIPSQHLTTLEIIRKQPDGIIEQHTILAAILCTYISGTPVAADDAEAAIWVPTREIEALNLTLVQDVSRVMHMAMAAEQE